MKRLINRKIFPASNEDELNYDAVEKVSDIIETYAKEIAIQPDVNIEISYGYSKFSKGFHLRCKAADNSIVITPQRYEVEYDIVNGFDTYTLLNPPYLESPYGDVEIKNKGTSGKHAGLLLNIIVSSSDFSDIAISSLNDDDSEIVVNELKKLLEKGLIEFSQDVEDVIAEIYDDEAYFLEKESKRKKAKAARSRNKALSRSVTIEDIPDIVKELKKVSPHKYRIDGDHLKVRYYEGDGSATYRLDDIVRGLAKDDITIGDALAEPDCILDYDDNVEYKYN